jgi:hypothetical protein
MDEGGTYQLTVASMGIIIMQLTWGTHARAGGTSSLWHGVTVGVRPCKVALGGVLVVEEACMGMGGGGSEGSQGRLAGNEWSDYCRSPVAGPSRRFPVFLRDQCHGLHAQDMHRVCKDRVGKAKTARREGAGQSAGRLAPWGPPEGTEVDN